MDTARYVVALMLVISVPPALLLWYLIHPFAPFWRKLGPVWTYTILGLPMVALMVWTYRVRVALLAFDFGTSYFLIFLSVLCVTGAAIIAVKRRKLLTFGILAGIPELSESGYPGTLLKEGIYSKVRHPRYVETLLGILGYALFANFLGSYVAFVLSIPALYFIVLLEERELRNRFGDEYETYSQRVPRFVPKLGR